MNRIFAILWLLGTVFFTAGCFAQDNFRVFKKNNVTLMGWTTESRKMRRAIFFRVVMGRPSAPLNTEAPDVCIDIKNWGHIPISQIRASDLEARAPFKDVDAEYAAGYEQWRPGIVYTIDGYQFRVIAGEVVEIEVVGGTGYPFTGVFLNHDKTRQYPLPLSDDQATELFGPADKIFNKFVP